jgi:hypothetical protein
VTSRQTSLRAAGKHGLALLIYAVVAVAVSWPVVRDFSSRIPSDGLDARHHLWVLWHVKEALLGNQALFDLALLYYPDGLTLLVHGMGPVVPMLALPFWFLGPEAAYNGAVLLGLTLTGFGMYVLARYLRFQWPIALFAGLVYMLSAIHLAGIYGHLHKTFLGLVPLVLVALFLALDVRRSARWAIAVGLLLLLELFHNGHTFVMSFLMVTFFAGVRLLQADRVTRPILLRRIGFVGLSILILVVPVLMFMQLQTLDPLYPGGKSQQATLFQPDLVEFFLPSGFHWLFGPKVLQMLGLHAQVETAVSLSFIGLVLAAVGLWKNPRETWPWLLFLLLFMILALGPSLKILGHTTIPMPFAFLAQLPGLNFMRTPGRFMLVGHLGLIIAACYGLAWIAQRWTRPAPLIMGGVLVVALLEAWPQPWPQETLPPVPSFLEQLASDEEMYGVFELPVRPTEWAWQTAYGSFYQMNQMVHKKGIPYGYISRVPVIHPQFPCYIPEPRPSQPDILVNDSPTDCDQYMQDQLAFYDYRYVVWHKPGEWSSWGYEAGSLGEREALAFLDQVLEDESPIYEDSSVRVYAVDPDDRNEPWPLQMGLAKNWYENEGDLRWAESPAWLFVSTPVATSATLEIEPAMMFTPDAGWHVGLEGELFVDLDRERVATTNLKAGESVSVPLELEAGTHLISLELAAGNFKPSVYDNSEDRRDLSFAIRSINLQTDSSGE